MNDRDKEIIRKWKIGRKYTVPALAEEYEMSERNIRHIVAKGVDKSISKNGKE